eukprot:CAMPEP_0114460126 /NCGR_PEP_ID=MMETSP0104-20121206/5580_1 /TAXON_ID=37642 ORGANISM="Paraphysomonas imperforata, Strain PA2" /NCGR_SAMPLE_ID=MMETSP0104 /ASSEMBLY_ACC=CAM_ASM_000202 /LENGTH=860 /DNA_ID=CAMNT_0001632819 /DNA_START=37 /DNA_END=2616 /DNA_ORIENTATION=-
MVDDSTVTSGATGSSSEYTSSTATSTVKSAKSNKLLKSSSSSISQKSQSKISATSPSKPTTKRQNSGFRNPTSPTSKSSKPTSPIKTNSGAGLPATKKELKSQMSNMKISKLARAESRADKNLKSLVKSQSTISLKSGKSNNSLLKRGLSSTSSPSLKRLSSNYSQMDSPDSKIPAHDESDFTNNTALFEKNLKVYRKFRVAVRETEDLIQNHHDRALKRVQERVMKETLESKLEVESRILKEKSLSIKESFVLEADVAKEDQEQLRALKLYHKHHIQRLLPMWFRSLNDCTECIASNGHSEKLEWRSKSRKLLLMALEEMEDDDSSDILKAKVRYLALSINARRAQQVLGILKLIREEYIRHKEGKSELGHHSIELRRVNGLLNPNKPCPLERGQWSTDLESSVSNIKHNHESSLIHQSAHGGLGSTILSIDDDFTLPSTDEDSALMMEGDGLLGLSDEKGIHNSYEFSRMSADETNKDLNQPSKQPFPKKKQSKKTSFMLSTASTPVNPHNNMEIMRLLRETSCQGLLQESWRVFSHFYGEYINNVKDKVFLQMNLKCVPTLETFKLLIMSFKNSDSNQFDDISTILILMKRANVDPDLEIFNMILRSCERRGAWRRALKYLKQMEVEYGIIPNTNSFGIVIDSCRHAPETPAIIFETLRNQKFPRKFCYQAAACNAGNRISTVAATDLFVDTFQNEPDFDIQNVRTLQRSVTAANAASSAYAPSKQWGLFNEKISHTLNWQSPAFHRTGPSVPAFQSQVLKIIAPQEKLIMANTNVKSGVVLGTSGANNANTDGASVASAVTFDTFDDSFASFKDLNKSFMRGADLEDSVYDASVADPSLKEVKNIPTKQEIKQNSL